MFALGTNSSRTFLRYINVCTKISRFIKITASEGKLKVLGINDARICHVVVTFGRGFFESVNLAASFETIVDSKQLMMVLRTTMLTTIDTMEIDVSSDNASLVFQFTAGYGICTTKRISQVDSLGWGNSSPPAIPQLPHSMILRTVVFQKLLASFACNSPTTVLSINVVSSEAIKLSNYDLMTSGNSKATTTDITLQVSELDAFQFSQGVLSPIAVPLGELKVLSGAMLQEENVAICFGTAGCPMLVKLRAPHLDVETLMTLSTGLSQQMTDNTPVMHGMPAHPAQTESDDVLNLMASLPVELGEEPSNILQLTPVATPEAEDVDEDIIPGTPVNRSEGFDWGGQFTTLW